MALVDDEKTALVHEEIGMSQAIVEDLWSADNDICFTDLEFLQPLISVPEIDAHVAGEVFDIDFGLLPNKFALLID